MNVTRNAKRKIFKPLRLDLYILGETFFPFLGGLLFFTFVFLMAQALRWAEMVIVHGVALSLLGKMASYMIISLLPFIIPPAFLLGVLFAFGRLSSDSELIAMKASGFNLLRLSAPVLILALAISFIEYELNMNWAPMGERALYRTIVRIGNTRVASSLKEGTFVSGFFDLLVYAEKVDPQTNKLKHIFLYDEREPKNPLVIVAKTGDILPVKTDTELGMANMLVLHNGNGHRNDPAENTFHKFDFKDYRLFLKLDEGADNAPMKPRMLPREPLLSRLKKGLQDSEYGPMLIEYWKRYALAVLPIIFVLLGVGYGTFSSRAIRAGAGLIAFLVTISYWVMLTIGTNWAQRGLVPVPLGMFLPNIVLLCIGIHKFRSAMR